MILLTFLFPLLVIISLVYFRSKRTFKSLKISGIICSLLILPLYFFVKNVDLASTPALAKTTNKTNEQLKVYYISFYDSYSPIVLCSDNLMQNEISKDQFETEGVAELWMVAINKSDQIRYLGKKKNVWSLSEIEFSIEDSKSRYNVQEGNRAISIIKRFKINRVAENSLFIGSQALLATLILKRKKTTNQ